MNRMEELQALERALEQSTEASLQTLDRAQARLRRRNRRISRTFGSVCAVFALFVVLVNFCAPVAYACSKVPGLRELAEAVKQGYECYLLFVVQMKGIREVRPNDSTHAAFGQALREAEKAGVKLLAVDCLVLPEEVTADQALPVCTDI